MKCLKHLDREAAAQCAKCGAGICSECAQQTRLLAQDYGFLCLDCYRAELQKIKEQSRKIQRSKKIFIAVAVILYILGVAVAAVGLVALSTTLDKVLFCIFGALLCGFFTALASWRASGEREIKITRERSPGVVEAEVHEEPGCLVRMIVTLFFAVLGVVVTPVFVVKSILTIRYQKRIEQGAENALRAAQGFSDNAKCIENG